MDGTLGSEVDVVGGAPPRTAVLWRGNDEETCPVIVTAQAVPEVVLRPFMRIVWGVVGMAHVTAEVDVGRGRQVVVAGSSVEVSVGADAVANVETKGKIVAMLSFGAVNCTESAERTVYFDDLGKGKPVKRLIPMFARELLPLQVSHPVALKICFLDSLDCLTIIGLPVKGDVRPILIPNEAVSFSVETLSDEPVAVRAPFSLALGGRELEAGVA